MKKALTLLMTVLVLAVGCSKSLPTIDASTDQTLKASLQRVQSSLPPEKQARFQAAVMLITISGMSVSETASGNVTARSLEQVKQRLNGKTGDEIIAEAEDIKQHLGH